jgi:hypothetical protein
MRLAAALLAVAVASCRSPKPGDGCERGARECQDPSTELACQGGRYIASPCKGPSGCALHRGQVLCDITGNAEGDLCTVEDEGKSACTGDGKAEVICKSGAFQVLRCLGPGRCRPTGSGSICDTSIADEGDRCRSGEGGGRFVPTWVCRGKAGCKIEGGKPACDQTAGEIGDVCSAGGVCSVDKKALLTCKDGKLALDKRCRGKRGCKDDGTGTLLCDMSIAEPGDACAADGDACTSDGASLLRCKGGRFVVVDVCACVVTGDSVRCGK